MTIRDQKMRKILYERQDGRCNAPCEDYSRNLGTSLPIRIMHNDHIDSNGPDGIENRQLLCPHCNQVKGDRGMAYLLNDLRKRWERMQLPLFNRSRIAKRRQPIEARKQQSQPQHMSLLVPFLVPL